MESGTLTDSDGRCDMADRAEWALENSLLHWTSVEGLLEPPIPADPVHFEEWIKAPTKDPRYEHIPSMHHILWTDPKWECQGSESSSPNVPPHKLYGAQHYSL